MGDMGRDRSSIVDRCVDAGVERFGVVKGARMGGRVALFVGQWCRYLEEHDGDDPTMIEFTTWAGLNRQATYRTLAEFRELFPEYETPRPFVGVPLTGFGRGVEGRDAVPA
jgi:hypothetical protein